MALLTCSNCGSGFASNGGYRLRGVVDNFRAAFCSKRCLKEYVHKLVVA